MPPSIRSGWQAIGRAAYQSLNQGLPRTACSSVAIWSAGTLFIRDSPEPSTWRSAAVSTLLLLQVVARSPCRPALHVPAPAVSWPMVLVSTSAWLLLDSFMNGTISSRQRHRLVRGDRPGAVRRGPAQARSARRRGRRAASGRRRRRRRRSRWAPRRSSTPRTRLAPAGMLPLTVMRVAAVLAVDGDGVGAVLLDGGRARSSMRHVAVGRGQPRPCGLSPGFGPGVTSTWTHVPAS